MGVGKIVRRTFLVGSAAVAGGVAFGYYYVTRPVKNPLLEGLGEGEAAITPFVKITPDGITLITPRADSGQGVYSMQAYLIAEELDIDPKNATLDPGEPHQAYYNSVLLQAAVPYPEYQHSWLIDTMRSMMETPAKLLSMQMTGGSTTVPDMHERLRKAGAVARETLKLAASKRTGVPVAKL
ncbi:MAG: xanthine dehydrogenase family protein molybdopterin-binding subunit, partial [Myxococcota bacterium]